MTETRLRFLFVEDVPADVELAEYVLKKEGLDFDARTVDTPEAFIEALGLFEPDLIISDYSMPTFDGMQALELSLANDPLRPFIVLTASRNEETAVACLKAGATDYVLKDRLTRLPFAVREALEQRRTHLAKETAERSLRASEMKFRTLFESAAVPIWEQDYADVKKYLDGREGADLGAYLDTHPDELAHCASLVHILAANQEALRVFQADHRNDLPRHYLPDYFTRESWRVFRDEIVAVMQGKTRFTSDLPFVDAAGKSRQSLLQMSVVPGVENSLGRILVSLIDLTEHKEMEQALMALSRRLFEAQEAERRNVARELHDEIGQVLTAIKSNLQTSRMQADRPSNASSLDEGISIVDKAIQQVRDLSLNLRPSLLDDFGLVPALEWYLKHQANRVKFVAEFVATPHEMDLPQTLATTCFRVAQAALTNIERHARAAHVRVELCLQHLSPTAQGKRSELRLVIVDDGVGFDSAQMVARSQRGETLGLSGMQERVWLAGGQIEFHSEPGHGTRIITRFPILEPKRERRSKRREL